MPPLLLSNPSSKKSLSRAVEKNTHPDHLRIKKLSGNIFECSFLNVFTSAATKIFWCPDGSVYLDKPQTGTVVAKAEKGGLLRIAGEMDMLTVVVLAVVARTWTGKGSCSCGVI